MPANMKNNRVDVSEIARISEHDAKRLKRHIVQTGDIVYSRRGDVTQKALIREHENGFFCGTGCLLLRPGKKIDPAFLTYYLSTKTYQSWIASQAVGATMPNLNTGILNRVSFCAPDKDDQKRIASVLSALDAKIELNNRINAELEGMAKLLYDYWFVQFDFPMTAAQAAALGKPKLAGHPYRASGGTMIYNETLKREIPEGWTATTLSKFANITMGQSPPGDSYNQEGSGLVFFQGSTDFGWRYPQVREFTTAPSRLAKAGDILLSVRAPVGTLNIADQDCCIGRGLAALNAKSGHDSFLFEVMLYFKTIFDRRNSSGTTFGSITKDDLHSLEFACPPEGSPLLDDFEEKMKPAHKTILLNHQQTQELTQLRDWLLPMLMNGQVTVG
jgi:type I restriction enzyme S subunit